MSARSACPRRSSRFIEAQPIAKRADREMRDFAERPRIMRVENQTGDFIRFIGRERLFEKSLQRHIGKRYLSGHAFFRAARGDSRQLVARAQRRGFGEQRFQIWETIN